MLEVRKMLSLPKYSVYSLFWMSQDHIIVKVIQQLKKLYYTLEDSFKNQDEKLAHFKPCKQDTKPTCYRHPKMLFDLYKQRI